MGSSPGMFRQRYLNPLCCGGGSRRIWKFASAGMAYGQDGFMGVLGTFTHFLTHCKPREGRVPRSLASVGAHLQYLCLSVNYLSGLTNFGAKVWQAISRLGICIAHQMAYVLAGLRVHVMRPHEACLLSPAKAPLEGYQPFY